MARNFYFKVSIRSFKLAGCCAVGVLLGVFRNSCWKLPGRIRQCRLDRAERRSHTACMSRCQFQAISLFASLMLANPGQSAAPPPDRWQAAAAPDLHIAGIPGDTARSIENFNAGWSFARFGKLPDGSVVREPGSSNWSVSATASSEEADRGNTAEMAFDGDADTRWCAANAAANQWLALDFGKPLDLGSIAISWEKPQGYAFTVEGSADTKSWSPLASGGADPAAALHLAGRFRHLRISTSALPAGGWASIREITLTDAAGAPIRRAKLVDAAPTPESAAFDAAGWRKLDLPHDWAIEGPFTFDVSAETGRLPWPGVGWYRKTFQAAADLTGKRVFLEFDGAMSHAQVWLNGQPVGERAYGYSSFQVELTAHLKPGAPNTVAVRLNNPPNSSRWYPGGGIYRNVRLVTTGALRVAPGGLFVTTPAVETARATVKVSLEIENPGVQAAEAVIETRIFALGIAAAGAPRAAAAPQLTRLTLAAGAPRTSAEQTFTVANPMLWNPAAPALYVVRCNITVAGKLTDTAETTFGIRTAVFDAKRGLLVNGQRLDVRGVCEHHDLGALGSAINTRALRRQLEILGSMGCNAIRTSHNPPAPELLDLCDRMGFVVMDEAFDCWKQGKTPNDYSRDFERWHERDLTDFVRRDRNHPCVVLWSIGNEIPEAGNAKTGPALATELRGIVHREDPSRQVGIGCDNPASGNNGMQDAVDVFGYNYKPHMYGEFLKNHPQRPLFGSETASCVSSRGEYFFPVSNNKGGGFFNYQVSSYDLYAPGWAYHPDVEFAGLDRNPGCAGEFVWTGFDYLGEPTPYNGGASTLTNFHSEAEKLAHQALLAKIGSQSPARSSYFGIIDLAGFPKDRYYLYQARWRPELPMAHLLPHWSWPERVGQVTPVHAYTSGDEAELFLNNKSLGRKHRAAGEYRLRWDDVKYEPGELRLVAYKNGAPWAQTVQRTATAAAKLDLTADRADFKADGDDLVFLTVRVCDAVGTLVPRAALPVTFTLTGPAEVIAVDNGDATSFEPFQASRRTTFNGLALAIVRAHRGQPGEIRVTATAEGLAPATATLHSR